MARGRKFCGESFSRGDGGYVVLMCMMLKKLKGEKMLKDPEQQGTLNDVDGFGHKLTEEKWLQYIAHAEAQNGFLIGLKGYDQATTLCWSLCSILQFIFPWREEGIRWGTEENASQSRIFSCLDTLLAPSLPLWVGLRHNYNFDERVISLAYRIHILHLSFK